MIKEGEVKMTGEFLGLYETVGHLFSSEEVFFFYYGYDKKKSKILHSHYRRRILNASAEPYLIGT